MEGWRRWIDAYMSEGGGTWRGGGGGLAPTRRRVPPHGAVKEVNQRLHPEGVDKERAREPFNSTHRQWGQQIGRSFLTWGDEKSLQRFSKGNSDRSLGLILSPV